MKYLTSFETEQLYTAAQANLDTPNVSLIEATMGLHYAPYVAPDPFNGHEYVDLGLPSGTLWATMNVGASSVTDYGNYYQYGKGLAQYAATSGDSWYSGTENPLSSEYDTAAQVWGGSWHMPTKTQCEELIANTTYQWVTNYQGSGINGAKFTANGQTLFIPAAGSYLGNSSFDGGYTVYIWSSTPSGSGDTYDAYYLHVDSGGEYMYYKGRDYGYSVRPVLDA